MAKLHDDDDGQMSFRCPGCGMRHIVATGEPYPNGARWDWNGSLDRPTFSPSILVRYDHWVPPSTEENPIDPTCQVKVSDICHSFVTDGRIMFLGDCTHALAGQTVELPDWQEGK